MLKLIFKDSLIERDEIIHYKNDDDYGYFVDLEKTNHSTENNKKIPIKDNLYSIYDYKEEPIQKEIMKKEPIKSKEFEETAGEVIFVCFTTITVFILFRFS